MFLFCSCGFTIIFYLKMNPDKRRTIESFFTSSNKKSRNDEEQDESNVLIPILFSPSESETLDPASLAPPSFSTDDQNTNDIISNTSSSSLCTTASFNESFERKSIPIGISTSCRVTKLPARFEQFIMNSTVDQREIISSSKDYINRIYFPLIDCMLVELNDRFSTKTLPLLKSISTVYPETTNFLNVDHVEEFSRHINIDSNALKNEFIVIKPMLQSKNIHDVIEFLNELIPISNAFFYILQIKIVDFLYLSVYFYRKN